MPIKSYRGGAFAVINSKRVMTQKTHRWNDAKLLQVLQNNERFLLFKSSLIELSFIR